MQITRYTDISLRVLMYLASKPTKVISISHLSTAYIASNNHMVKVVHNLVRLGYLESVRGRNGGVRLNGDSNNITVSEIVRKTENHDNVINCGAANCPLHPRCSLTGVLQRANDAFYTALDGVTLADLTVNNPELKKLVNA
jgi:Rrf2 family nitric oxide-sensitive transcriptional repressor